MDEPVVLARFTVEPDGTAAIPVPLGGRPGLVGKEIYFQALFSDPSDGGPASMTSMSDGLHVDVCE